MTLRIALSVHHELDRNTGAAGATMALADALRGRGNEVQIFSLDDFAAKPRHVPGRVWRRVRPAAYPYMLAARLRTNFHQFDVLDFLSGDGGILFPWLGRRRIGERPAMITHGQGLEHVYASAMRDLTRPLDRGWRKPATALFQSLHETRHRLWLVKRSYERADAAVFANKADLGYGNSNFRLGGKECCVSPNGIPHQMLGLPAPVSRVSSRGLGIAVIGDYIPRKGIEFGAQALGPLLAQFPQVHVRFLGTGCDKERVLIDYDGAVHQQITVVSRYDRIELPNLLDGCEVMLFPTIAEGFGMVLVEAMACGLAPVSTRTPGPSDIISHGVDGLLVPPSDAVGLKCALLKMLTNDDLRYRMRINAHRRAQEFSWNAIAERRERLHLSLLRAGSPSQQ